MEIIGVVAAMGVGAISALLFKKLWVSLTVTFLIIVLANAIGWLIK